MIAQCGWSPDPSVLARRLDHWRSTSESKDSFSTLYSTRLAEAGSLFSTTLRLGVHSLQSATSAGCEISLVKA